MRSKNSDIFLDDRYLEFSQIFLLFHRNTSELFGGNSMKYTRKKTIEDYKEYY